MGDTAGRGAPWAGGKSSARTWPQPPASRPPVSGLAQLPEHQRPPQLACPPCPGTCIRTWCCPVGTHSRPSSGQQPPQRCTVTQLGTSCLATVPMSSTVKGTTTSRGWQVARVYTSIHDTTAGRPIRVKSPLGFLQLLPAAVSPVPRSQPPSTSKLPSALLTCLPSPDCQEPSNPSASVSSSVKWAE